MVQLLCQDSRCCPAIVNKKNIAGDTPLMIAVYFGYLDIVKKLDIEGTDFLTTDRQGRSLMEVARMENADVSQNLVGEENDRADVLQYLLERKKVDSLKVIAAVNVARFVGIKADVQALEIPEKLEQFLEGFVDESK